MSNATLSEVRMRLLRSGIAMKYVDRAILELNCHFEESIDHAKLGGVTNEAAESMAVERIGDTEKLVAGFLARPELLSMTRRHPLLTHGLGPLMIMCLSCALVTGASFTIGSLLKDRRSATDIPVARRLTNALHLEFTPSPLRDSPPAGFKNAEFISKRNASESR